MSELLIIDKSNTDRLERYGSEMASIYIDGFADPPWNERSKCINNLCSKGFAESVSGSACSTCGSILVDAYESKELIEGWQKVLDDDGMIQLALLRGVPVCVTIARPTNPQELYERKYIDVPAMQPWLEEYTPGEKVWIEDTFANRNIVPRGNLRNRAQVLGNIALKYGGLEIVTRTLAESVIAATVRDAGWCTDMYLGSKSVGSEWSDGVKFAGNVPDGRTLLRIEGVELL